MALTGKTVAVTGATGFIGRYIVRSLRESGATVIGVVRNPGKVPALRELCTELRQADLADRDALAAGISGCDAVINNAALVATGAGDPMVVINTNTTGTDNVLHACARASVPRLIQVSSIAAYARKSGHVYAEDDPLWPESAKPGRFSCYGISKANAERLCHRRAAEFGLDVTIARPHLTFGANDDKFIRAMSAFLSPKWISIWFAGTRIPGTYAGDVANGLCLMLANDKSIGKTYNVCNPPASNTFWELMSAWKQAGGRTPRIIIPVPFPLKWWVESTRTFDDLGWQPRTPLAAFQDMVAIERGEVIL